MNFYLIGVFLLSGVQFILMGDFIFFMVQAGGLEPPAYFLGGSRSILMSYACNVSIHKTIYLKTQELFGMGLKNITLLNNLNRNKKTILYKDIDCDCYNIIADMSYFGIY